MQIEIGKSGKQEVSLDVAKLLDTRALIQGTSGSGKSWLLRLIAERCGGKLQTIILDPEGEFATLREKLDLVLVGRHGEVAANPRTAALLARRLKELRLSAVIDLSELKLHERRGFVKLFLEAMIDLPRELWSPSLVVIDEAHLYCPESGSGESESTAAIVDLCSRGRKRGLCPILVTQRLSKVKKDAASELGNVFIGRTPLDVDTKRAVDILGMSQADRRIFVGLEDGEFFGFGPAFNSREIVRFRSANVTTTHPKPGQRSKIEPPKPSATINKVLSQFADLPKEAAEEIKNLTDAKKRIAELERESRKTTKPVDAKAVETAFVQGEARGRRYADAELRQLRAAVGEREGRLTKIERLAHLNGEALSNRPAQNLTPSNELSKPRESVPNIKLNPARAAVAAPVPALGKAGDRRMLIALAQNPEGLNDRKLSILAGVSRKGGSFGTYLSRLRTCGYMEGDRAGMRITDVGLEALGDFEPLPTGPALVAYWQDQLGSSAGDRRMFDALVGAYPSRLSKGELSEASGVSMTGGSFGTYLSRLRTLDLIEGKDSFCASQTLFE